MLTELVRAGKLPPVDQRLPDEPPEVEPVDSIGTYGGTWRRMAIHTWDTGMGSRLGYEPIVRWDRSGRKVAPGLAKSWEVLDAGRTYRFHLYRGIKWSDGHPFTSADVQFWYDDVATNKDLSPVFPDWMSPGGNRLKIVCPDPYTVEFRSEKPNGVLLEILAYRGHNLYQPKHYLRQFHARHAAPDELAKQVAEVGLDLWHQLYRNRSDLHENPDLPTLRPFKIATVPPSTRMIAERNPYYWKVDPDGNQLPYIDRIAFAFVQNKQLVNLKAMTGGVDMQARYMDASNYTLFKESSKQGGYRVLANVSPQSICLYMNQHSKDEQMRGIIQDRRFRIALSVAVNRDELVELIFAGMAEPTRAIANRLDPYYLPWFDEIHIKYDPRQADRLLDEVGLKRAGDNMRTMPNGEPFRQILHVYPSETGTGAELWELVADYWHEVGLDFAVKVDAAALSSLEVRNGNADFWAYATTGMHWIVEPLWYVPVSRSSYYAPLYGRYFATGGKSGVPPTPEFQRLLDWYKQLAESFGDEERKLDLGRRILSQCAREVYTIGIARAKELTIVSNRFKNMPDRMIHSYQVMAPGYIGIEQFYLDDE